ncbi:MAG: lipid IV(A) 3-deoxy-D-manno-octulosonic acid transferase [Agarilytica sp.]
MPYIARIAYTCLFSLLLPLLLLKMAWRNLRDKKGDRKAGSRLRLLERMGLRAPYVGQTYKTGGVVFHVVSVGEAIAATHLIREFYQHNPGTPICVTCTTPTGSNLIQKKLGDIASHCYLPFDLPIFLAFFLNRLQPTALFILETEIWPNLNAICHQRKIALTLINARLSQKSVRGYQKILPLARPAVLAFDKILCQNDSDQAHFLAIGANKENCHVLGNLKFDIHLDDALIEKASQIHGDIFSNRACWIAASTHPGEDESILFAHKKLLETFPELVLILAPRHPQRAADVSQICEKLSLPVVLRTQEQRLANNENVFILDTIGELMPFYRLGHVCFIGGSIIEHGGHNPLEPALLKKPIISGPHVHNFQKVFDELQTENAVQMLNDGESMAEKILFLFENESEATAMGERAFHYLDQHRGATSKTLEVLTKMSNKKL